MPKTGTYLIALAAIVTLLAIPLLYVLSTGPAFWLSQNGYVDEARLPPVYRPIHWGIWKSDRFRHFMWDYLALWDESIEFMSVDPFQPPSRFVPGPVISTDQASRQISAEAGYMGMTPDESSNNVKVVAVRKGGPADIGGLRPNDVITHVNGQPCPTLADFDGLWFEATVGTELELIVDRDGVKRTVLVTLGVRPEPQFDQPSLTDPIHDLQQQVP